MERGEKIRIIRAPRDYGIQLGLLGTSFVTYWGEIRMVKKGTKGNIRASKNSFVERERGS